MALFATVFIRTLVLFFRALELLLLARAILSWFPPSGRPGPVRTFIVTVTEFAIAPVRSVLDRFEFARRSPIDLSFLVTYLLISALTTFLSL